MSRTKATRGNSCDPQAGPAAALDRSTSATAFARISPPPEKLVVLLTRRLPSQDAGGTYFLYAKAPMARRQSFAKREEVSRSFFCPRKKGPNRILRSWTIVSDSIQNTTEASCESVHTEPISHERTITDCSWNPRRGATNQPARKITRWGGGAARMQGRAG